jgi:hypothetical protein
MKHSQVVNQHLQTTCHLNKRNLLQTIVEDQRISAYLQERLRVNEPFGYQKDRRTTFPHLGTPFEPGQEEATAGANDFVASVVVLLLMIEHILVDHNNTNNSEKSKQQRGKVFGQVVF